MAAILDVQGLKTSFSTPDGTVRAVNNVSFAINAGGTFEPPLLTLTHIILIYAYLSQYQQREQPTTQ